VSLNAKQVEQLLKPVNPRRVQRDNNGQSHLAAWDVSAHLTRVFGFGGWEKHITSLELVAEEGVKKGERTGWFVTYRCQMTLLVKDPSGNVVWSGDDGATGSAQNLPQRGEAHDFAVKNAISYALKRCAKDLGDQFGLSLYNKGSLKAVVGAVLADGSETDVDQALPAEMHPDADDSPQSPEVPAETAPAEGDWRNQPPVNHPRRDSNGNGHAPQPARQADGPQVPPRPAEGNDPGFAAWGAKIDEITDEVTAMRVRDELATSELDEERKGQIGNAIDAKVAGLPTQRPRPQRPKGPPATERGAIAVPTGNGDDGSWVQHFEERLGLADADDLGSLQKQVGAAVTARKITPSKAADLTKAIQAKRHTMREVPA
jgi:hypothetical protein